MKSIEDVKIYLQQEVQKNVKRKCKCFSDGYKHDGICEQNVLELLDHCEKMREQIMIVEANNDFLMDTKQACSYKCKKNKLKEYKKNKKKRDILFLYTYEYERRIINHHSNKEEKMDDIDKIIQKINSLRIYLDYDYSNVLVYIKSQF